MDLGIKGKVAMVTGASRSIGKACASMLAEEGCNLAICARGKEALDQTAAELTSKGVEVLAVSLDVTNTERLTAFVNAAVEKFGGVDILVNNAGKGDLSDMMQLPEEEIRDNMELMFYAPVRFSRAVIPHMKKKGWGRIINISSVFGKQPGGLLDYDAIKAAVNMFTKDLSNYLCKDGILVNAVCPGPIRGPLWDGPGRLGEQLGGVLGMSGPDAVKWYAENNIPLGHHGDPEDIASMVTFLASEKAKFITGQLINVDGGMVKTAF